MNEYLNSSAIHAFCMYISFKRFKIKKNPLTEFILYTHHNVYQAFSVEVKWIFTNYSLSMFHILEIFFLGWKIAKFRFQEKPNHEYRLIRSVHLFPHDTLCAEHYYITKLFCRFDWDICACSIYSNPEIRVDCYALRSVFIMMMVTCDFVFYGWNEKLK